MGLFQDINPPVKVFSFKNILIATDFSNAAKNAAEYVMQLLKNNSCSYTLLHTYEIPFTEAQNVIQVHDLLKTHAINKLNDEAARLNKIYRCSFITKVSMGTLVTTINRLALLEKTDMVVLGSHTDKTLEEIISGSTISSVIKNIKIPILIVPEKYNFKVPDRILFATDYHKINNKALSPLIHLAKQYHSEVTLFNVLYERGQLTDEEKENKKLIEKTLIQIPCQHKSIKNSNIVKDILETNENNHYDMLYMIPRHHSFIDRLIYKSITVNVAQKANVPVLAVNENM